MVFILPKKKYLLQKISYIIFIFEYNPKILIIGDINIIIFKIIFLVVFSILNLNESYTIPPNPSSI